MGEPSRRRLLALLAGLALAPAPALASGGGKAAENYVKLPQVVVEYWSQDGLFHAVNADLTVVFALPEVKLDKKVGDKITRTLSAMTWEEFSRGNPAATIKAIALDLVRKEPGGESALEVLISRLMIR